MRSARFIIFALLFLFLFPARAMAQTPPSPGPTQAVSNNSFNSPNVDSNVPRNQHYYAQSVTIEVLSAVFCQLTGVDPINPALGCLGINPETNKLGLAPSTLDENGTPKVGGLIGGTSGLIATLYTPTVSTSDYTRYLSDNFGIVKKAQAQAQAACDPQNSGYGFCGLQPVFELWKTVRNISYMLLVLAFVFIGMGIMLRVKIDPRTVMSIQNQIPKMIMAILLITFSYAISALMVDLTWTTTYAGIYALTSNSKANPPVSDCTDNKGDISLSEKATTTILQTPITYFNQIFARCSAESGPLGIGEGDSRDGGLRVVTGDVAGAVGQTVNSILRSLILGEEDASCGFFEIGCKVKQGAVNALSNIVSIVMFLVIFIVLLVALFRVWFQLLKSYVYSLIFVITGPIFIVFGLWPTKPLGFEKWLRNLFVNLAVFPLTAFVFVAARLLLELYKDTDDKFIPPLVGNPAAGVNFGALLAFGAILIAPSIQNILKEKMGVKGIGSPGLIAAGIAGGASVVGAPASRAIKHLNRTDQQGRAVGSLALAKKQATDAVLQKGAKLNIPLAERTLKKREAIEIRDYHVSEGQVIAQWKKDNPSFIRRRFNRNGRNKKGGSGSTT